MLGIIVPIPTGFKTYTVTLTAKRFLLYHCAACGKRNIREFEIKGIGSGQYHALQSKDKKAAVQKAAEEVAKTDLDRHDQRLFQQINAEHDYGTIGFAVNCPDCGELQPWSDMRGIFRKSSRLSDLKAKQFEPPTYVNASNIDLLSDQRAPQVTTKGTVKSADESTPVNKPTQPSKAASASTKPADGTTASTPGRSPAKKSGENATNPAKPVARFCAKCGASMPPNAAFCPKCGHRRIPTS